MTRHTRIVMSVIFWAFVVYLFLPLFLMVLMGFKDSRFIGFPITSWTLDWYIGVFQDRQFIEVFFYSVTIAVVSTMISLAVGSWIAVLLAGRSFFGRAVILALTILPAVIPGIISAIALRIYARAVGIETGMFAIIMGHAIHNVPFVALVVMARLSTLPKSMGEAAQDLGADAMVTFFRITLPYLRPAMIGAAVFCLLLSFDDFVRSFFLGGYQPTLPVLIFSKMRAGMSPEINAISTIVLVLTAVIGVWAERASRKLKKGA